MTRARRLLIASLPMALACGGCAAPGAPAPAATRLAPTAAQCTAAIVSGDPNTSVPPRCISFAGYQWVAKASTRFDPGPNTWSDEGENVWVDERGLHLRITNRAGVWSAAEVVLNASLGYGTYTFRTDTRLDLLDPGVVLGLFTYNYADPAFGHRELDIEFSPSLGRTPGANAHFSVQPYQLRDHTYDFTHRSSTSAASHSIDWRDDRIVFQSGPERWTFAGTEHPVPGGENVRLNLWLFGGRPPSTGLLEVIVSGFEFRR